MKNWFKIPSWVHRLVRTPNAELTRWQYAFVFFVELGMEGARQLKHVRAGEMAAALAFRTIFGLVPLIILATLVFRSVGGTEMLRDLIEDLLGTLNLQDAVSPDESLSLSEWISTGITAIDENLKGQAIGALGLLVLGWAAIRLLTTIERSFNVVCQSRENRSIVRRILLYWAAVTAGPALLVLSFRIGSRIAAMFDAFAATGWLATIISAALSFVATWIFILCMYKFVPHAQVKIAYALIGSAVATAFWLTLTNSFGAYLNYSFSRQSSMFSKLYGSIALIPLFLLWIHLLWVTVLYGLELTHLLQTVGGRMDRRLLEKPELAPLTDPTSIVPVMAYIADQFRDGRSVKATELAGATHISPGAVNLVLETLVSHQLLHRLDDSADPAFALARPPENIDTRQLLDIAYALTQVGKTAGDAPASEWVERFRQAMLDAPGHQPLADLTSR